MTGQRRGAMGWVRAGLLALTLALPMPGLAQTILDGPTRQVDSTGALLPRAGTSVVTKSEALLGPVNGGAAPQSSATWHFYESARAHATGPAHPAPRCG